MYDLNKPVYICDLLSITPYSFVCTDKTKKENMEWAETESVATIMVQPTLSRRFFREIITKKLIPVYCKTWKINNYKYWTEELINHVPNSPCFIKYREVIVNGKKKGTSLEVATEEELKEYIEQHISFDGKCNSFLEDLNGIFAESEKCYQYCLSKNYISNIKKLKKQLINEIKR